MSRLGETVLQQLVRLRSAGAKRPELGSETEEYEAYIRWQFESSPRLFARYPNWDIAGKRVLEIGCGTGGRAAYLATCGAARVVAIDINAEEIASARCLCPRLFPETAGRVEYLVAQESGRLPIGQFDVVLLVDAMEHVVSPPGMMRLAHDYTAPGGRFYFSSIGWYHRHGSHTGLLPFVNLFFSDETILNVVRWEVSRSDYRPTRHDSDPPIERWRGIYDLRDRPGEHLNKLTVAEMKKLVRYGPFSRCSIRVVGPGGRHPVARLLSPLSRVPVLQEVYHSVVVVECRRGES